MVQRILVVIAILIQFVVAKKPLKGDNMVPLRSNLFILHFGSEWSSVLRNFFYFAQYHEETMYTILTNATSFSPYELFVPPNVVLHEISINAIVKATEAVYGIQNEEHKLTVSNPYKLCDYRPYFGIIFSDLLKGYTHWGWCDLDLVLGNVLSPYFLPIADVKRIMNADAFITSYEMTFLFNGPYSILRKSTKSIQLYLMIPNAVDKLRENTEVPWGAEELGMSMIAKAQEKLNNYSLYHPHEMACNDMIMWYRGSTFMYKIGKRLFLECVYYHSGGGDRKLMNGQSLILLMDEFMHLGYAGNNSIGFISIYNQYYFFYVNHMKAHIQFLPGGIIPRDANRTVCDGMMKVAMTEFPDDWWRVLISRQFPIINLMKWTM